jgi:O-antigen ligase
LLFAFSLVLLFGLLIGFLEENYPARVRGLIEGPNFLGLFSSIFLALLAFFKISKVTFNRAYYIILVFVGGISLEASGTRASAITLFLFLLILMILSENSRKQICSFGALVMVAGILFTLANNFYPNYEKILESGAIISVTNSGYTSSGRILRINPGEGEGGVFSGRIGIWKLYGEKVIEKPILGHGFNPVSSLENIYPHNILILLAYYFGIPFTLIVCYKFSRLCRRLIIARKYKLLNVLVFLTLNSLFADFIFGAGGPIWLSMGLLIVLSVHSSDHAP